MSQPPARRASGPTPPLAPQPRIWRPGHAPRPDLHLGRRFAPLLRRWRGRGESSRLLLAFGLATLGLLLAAGGAVADVYLHRGIETGAEAPMVAHPTGRGLATNVDLTLFASEQLDGVAATLQSAGMRFARQSFAWSEIEPERGRFVWDRYDAIVAALNEAGVTPVAVLHRAPGWARAEATRGAADAPPVDLDAYGEFVAQVVGHYGNALPFVQLWDGPNRADRWGGASPDPVAYTALLARGSNAVRSARLGTKIVLAEFDPVDDGGGDSPRDLAFLAGVYEAGGGPFFDIVAARLDGGGRSPYDRWVDADRRNLSRAILFRELMVDAGDAAKPVWATRYGWRLGDGEGGVSSEEQAAFVVAGLERARAEWPWMGLLFAWAFAPQDGNGAGLGYALVGDDGAATPLLDALGAFARDGRAAVAPTGHLPVEAPQVDYGGEWAAQHLNDRVYRTTGQVGARLAVRFAGTGLTVVLRRSPQAGPVDAAVDGSPVDVDLGWFEATDVPWVLADGLDDTTHELRLGLTGAGQLTVGGIVVRRDVPGMWPVVLVVGAGLALVVVSLRRVAYTVAQRSGHLQRRGVDLWPELPQLPDWRPTRRA